MAPKKKVQMTLFNKPCSKTSCLHRDGHAHSVYDTFLDRYYHQNSHRGTKQEVCIMASKHYAELKTSGQEAIEKYIEDVDTEVRAGVEKSKNRTSFVKTVPIQDEGASTSTADSNPKASDEVIDIAGSRFSEEKQSILSQEKRMVKCKQFATFLGIDGDRLFSPDVVEMVDFMNAMSSAGNEAVTHKDLYDTYKDLSTYNKEKSKIAELGNSIMRGFQDLTNLLQEVSNLQMGNKRVMGGQGLLESAVQKQRLMKDATIKALTLENELKSQIPRLRVRISQLKHKIDPIEEYSSFTVGALNGMDLTWNQAISNVLEASEEGRFKQTGQKQTPGPLAPNQIIECAKILKDTNAMPLNGLLNLLEVTDISATTKTAMSINLQEWLPVIVLRRLDVIILINIHEIVLNATAFEDLLNIDLDVNEDTPDVQDPETPTEKPPADKKKPGPATGHGGRPKKYEQFPDITQEAISFLKLHAFSAQPRRRTTTACSSGVTVQQLRNHLFRVIPGLKEAGMSAMSVQRLMVAPRKNTAHAKTYHGVVPARIPMKSNKAQKKEHKDLHFTRAQVSYANEMGSLFGRECLRISSDDKNKVNVGTLAVSRYHQIYRYYLTSDCPDYLDHDFPYAASKIIPSGYLIMKTKRDLHQRSASLSPPPRTVVSNGRSRSLSPHSSASGHERFQSGQRMKQDKLGRNHVNYGKTGNLHVFNRASKFHNTSAQTHANDLHQILTNKSLREGKHAVIITADNGPDQSVKSTKTLIYQGRLWRDLNLDYLCVCSFAAGHSAQNMIEHCWAPLSRLLTSVTLPITIEGDDVPPWEQTGLSNEEKDLKTHQVFDNAIDLLNGYWNTNIDGFQVYSNSVKTSDEPYPYNDFKLVSDYTEKSLKQVQLSADLRKIHEEHRFFLEHCVKRHNMLELVKCTSPDCGHCFIHPIRAERMMAFLQSIGGRCITPTLSNVHHGHYKTFLESSTEIADLKKEPPRPDVGLPSLEGNIDKYTCPRKNCNIVFNSKTDKEHHDLMFHREERKTDQQAARRKRTAEEAADKRLVCNFKIEGNKCGFEAPTYYQLRKHKDQQGHKKSKKSKPDNAE